MSETAGWAPPDCEFCGACMGHAPDCGSIARSEALRLRREVAALRKADDEVAVLVEGELPEWEKLSGREVLVTVFGNGEGELAVKDTWGRWGPPQKLNPAD